WTRGIHAQLVNKIASPGGSYSVTWLTPRPERRAVVLLAAFSSKPKQGSEILDPRGISTTESIIAPAGTFNFRKRPIRSEALGLTLPPRYTNEFKAALIPTGFLPTKPSVGLSVCTRETCED
ncbi:hypothetical protein ACO22_06248, partial [Paracoccidioides brasiliensis]